ncbi:MAG TPA: aldehyde dehydrogenase family protein, partial [Thermoplasmata archaeon]|nr:aldehyde dehydrogenase family protein [Thermoplasmata archaeon]
MIWNVEHPTNDVNTIRSYAPNSPDRERLLVELKRMRKETVEIPLLIGGTEVRTSQVIEVRAPDDRRTVLARAHIAGEKELKASVRAALSAHDAWASMDWYHRVAVFQKAATLLAGPRRTRNIAALMLNHSKNP